jgi:hypothetical protein
MTWASKHAFDDTARSEPGSPTGRAAAQGSFVITLCSTATPVTLPEPKSPQLTRFVFFFSRSQEDGDRRYQLHMGYFSTLSEAQKWHKILRGVYPDAFVSETRAGQTDMLSDSQVVRILEQSPVSGTVE